MKPRLRNDVLLIGGVLLVSAVIALIFFLTRKEGAYAVVLQAGEETARYSLQEDGEYPILRDGEVTNLLVIQEGKADITDATCPDRICVEHRPISGTGETIVCLPNEVVVKIEAGEQNAPDLVV